MIGRWVLQAYANMRASLLRASSLYLSPLISSMSSLYRKLVSNSMITIDVRKERFKRRQHKPASSNITNKHQIAIYQISQRKKHSHRLRVAVPPEATTLAEHPANNKLIIHLMCIVVAILLTSVHLARLVSAYKGAGGGGSSSSGGERMVRLCIASVDPIKLTSQCVMCNRREFPLTVIDCTGITKVNDLIANPLSVQEATCLIYNCRRQVPDVKPEPYHGSVSHAVNYRGAASNYHQSGIGGGPGSGSNVYEMMAPSGVFGGGYSMYPSSSVQSQQPSVSSASSYMTRFGSLGFGASNPFQTAYSPYSSSVPRGLIGGPSLGGSDRHQGLSYALVPAPRAFPFGSRKYKAALVPLFRR